MPRGISSSGMPATTASGRSSASRLPVWSAGSKPKAAGPPPGARRRRGGALPRAGSPHLLHRGRAPFGSDRGGRDKMIPQRYELGRRWWRGFTLLELLVVIAVMAILTDLLLPVLAQVARSTE